MKKYILDETGNPKPEDDLVLWARWLETADRRVARAELPDGVEVSTVFLGFDHGFRGGSPILYETMIFGGSHSYWQRRSCTREEALLDHAKAIQVAMGFEGDVE